MYGQEFEIFFSPAGPNRQTSHHLSDPGVQRLPGGGSGDFPFRQRRCGQVSLLPGAESAGLEHQAVSTLQPFHHPEGAQPQPLRAQVQGEKFGRKKRQLASETFCRGVWKVTKHVSALDLPRRRSSAVIASSCGALNATRRGITGSNVVSIGKETSCCEPGRVS